MLRMNLFEEDSAMGTTQQFYPKWCRMQGEINLGHATDFLA